MSMKLHLAAFPLVFACLAGCGHTEDEWQAQLDKYNKLQDRSAASI